MLVPADHRSASQPMSLAVDDEPAAPLERVDTPMFIDGHSPLYE